MQIDLKSLDPDILELLEETVSPVESLVAQVRVLEDKFQSITADFNRRLVAARQDLARATRRASLLLKAGGISVPDVAMASRLLQIHEGSTLLVDEDPPAPPAPPKAPDP